jgi:hypothetical protein
MKFIAILAFTALILNSCGSTKEMRNRSYPERYTVELPKSWKGKPKLLRMITDILSTSMIELKDREFCIDCNAGYTVKIEFTEPITDQLAIRTEGKELLHPGMKLYSFGAAFVLYNSSSQPIVFMRIVNEDDAFLLSNNAYRAQHGPAELSLPQAVKMGGGKNSLDIDPRSYSQGNHSYSSSGLQGTSRIHNTPDQKDLLIATEQRIRDLYKLISQFETANSN